MLNKLLRVRKLTPSPPAPAAAAETSSLALKVVHAGGKVERYYMAIPAARIMEKYPSFVVARPDVFRRPLESVVRPEEILTPGQKFFVVPRRTVRKLRRRFREAAGGDSCVLASEDETEAASKQRARGTAMFRRSEAGESSGGEDSESSSCFRDSYKIKKIGLEKHVTFLGIDDKPKETETAVTVKKSSPENQKRNRRRRVRKSVTWEPSLTAINESQGN